MRNRLKKAREALRKVLRPLVPANTNSCSPSDDTTAAQTEDEKPEEPQELSKSQKKRLAARLEKEKAAAEAAGGQNNNKKAAPKANNPAPQKVPAPKTPEEPKYEQVPEQWRKIFSLEFPEETWQSVSEESLKSALGGGDGGKKKKKAAKKDDEDDFDALLAEFAPEAGPAKKKKGKK